VDELDPAVMAVSAGQYAELASGVTRQAADGDQAG
jgi:hypothetical protein